MKTKFRIEIDVRNPYIQSVLDQICDPNCKKARGNYKAGNKTKMANKDLLEWWNVERKYQHNGNKQHYNSQPGMNQYDNSHNHRWMNNNNGQQQPYRNGYNNNNNNNGNVHRYNNNHWKYRKQYGQFG